MPRFNVSGRIIEPRRGQVFLYALGQAWQTLLHHPLRTLCTTAFIAPVLLTIVTAANLLYHWQPLSHTLSQQQHLYLTIQPKTSIHDMNQLKQALTQHQPVEILHVTSPTQGLNQLIKDEKLPTQVAQLPADSFLPSVIEIRIKGPFSAHQFLSLSEHLATLPKIEAVHYDAPLFQAYAYFSASLTLLSTLFILTLLCYGVLHHTFSAHMLKPFRSLIPWHYQQGYPLYWLYATVACIGLFWLGFTILWVCIDLQVVRWILSPLYRLQTQFSTLPSVFSFSATPFTYPLLFEVVFMGLISLCWNLLIIMRVFRRLPNYPAK